MVKYYTPDEVASFLKIKPNFVYQFISEKKLKGIRMGSNYRITKDEFDRFKRIYLKKIKS
ncbi:MAG: helix-turn-helix domain-containing protein [Candidatus Woesearchaeota archaeon]